MTEQIPRLEFEALQPDLAADLAGRVERLGYLGEFFRCMGHQPAALRDFMAFTESAKAPLPDNLVEVIALTVATKTGNDYERNQHERLSVRRGFGRDWVERVEALNGTGLDEGERAVQIFVLACLADNGRGAGAQLGTMVARIGHQAAVAVMMVIGRYVTHSMIVNCLALAPPVPSIFEDGFAG